MKEIVIIGKVWWKVMVVGKVKNKKKGLWKGK